MFLGASALSANTIPQLVPYSGSFDESSIAAQDGLPAGDYDTLGGVDQVGLFQLVGGANTFTGSVRGPTDTADVFLIEILTGFELISASIEWATNLPGIEAPDIFNLPAGFLQQSTFGANAPVWTVEESDQTPEIFTLDTIEASMVGATFDVAPANYDAPGFDARGPGIYSSIFDGKTSCAQTFEPNPPGVSATCVDALDYTLTFNVRQTAPMNPVPLPANTLLLLTGLLALPLGRLGWLRRSFAPSHCGRC